MENNNLPGLTPAWLITLATVLGVFITIAVPAILGSEGIKASDWLGFAGNVLTAGVAAIAVYFGWRGITRQVRIGIVSREEERIERDLPGLRDLQSELGILRAIGSFRVTPAGVLRILKNLKYLDERSTIETIAVRVPRADDASRRTLAAIIQAIMTHAAVSKALSDDIDGATEQDKDMAQLAAEEDKMMKEHIAALEQFGEEVALRIAQAEARLPKFRSEIQSFFDS